MSDRQKLPPYIVALNIIMIVIFLAICGLIFALTMSAKELGWSIPTADDNSSPTAGSLSESAAGTADSSTGEVAVTVQSSAE